MRRTRLIGIIGGMFSSCLATTVPVYAASTESEMIRETISATCSSHDDPSIDQIKRQIDYAYISIPQIPPEDARYFDKEFDAANKVLDPDARGRRLRALEARRLYQAWWLHKQIEDLREAVKNILTPKEPYLYATGLYKDPEVGRLARAMRAYSLLMNYSESVLSFASAEDRYPERERLVTVKQYSKIYTDSLDIPFELMTYMECKLARIAGKDEAK